MPDTAQARGDRPRVLVLPPDPLYGEIMSPQSEAKLAGFARVVRNTSGKNLTSAELAERIPGVEAVLTSWGSPTFTDVVLARADRLRIIGHAAGSIRNLTPPAVFQRGITVTHAAGAIADSVAEMNVGLMLLLLRNLHRMDRAMHEVGWSGAKNIRSRELYGKKVGILALGYTARKLISLLRPFNCDLSVYDPYATGERFAQLGVRKASLDEVMSQSDIVSVHIPITPETRHLLGARELGLMKDGVIFTCTARSWVVDQDALLAELRTGRFDAALDVFDQEPLPDDSPFRTLENVVLTPHMAGRTEESRNRLAGAIVDEFARFFAGEPLKYPVTERMLATMG